MEKHTDWAPRGGSGHTESAVGSPKQGGENGFSFGRVPEDDYLIPIVGEDGELEFLPLEPSPEKRGNASLTRELSLDPLEKRPETACCVAVGAPKSLPERREGALALEEREPQKKSTSVPLKKRPGIAHCAAVSTDLTPRCESGPIESLDEESKEREPSPEGKGKTQKMREKSSVPLEKRPGTACCEVVRQSAMACLQERKESDKEKREGNRPLDEGGQKRKPTGDSAFTQNLPPPEVSIAPKDQNQSDTFQVHGITAATDDEEESETPPRRSRRQSTSRGSSRASPVRQEIIRALGARVHSGGSRSRRSSHRATPSEDPRTAEPHPSGARPKRIQVPELDGRPGTSRSAAQSRPVTRSQSRAASAYQTRSNSPKRAHEYSRKELLKLCRTDPAKVQAIYNQLFRDAQEYTETSGEEEDEEPHFSMPITPDMKKEYVEKKYRDIPEWMHTHMETFGPPLAAIRNANTDYAFTSKQRQMSRQATRKLEDPGQISRWLISMGDRYNEEVSKRKVLDNIMAKQAMLLPSEERTSKVSGSHLTKIGYQLLKTHRKISNDSKPEDVTDMVVALATIINMHHLRDKDAAALVLSCLSGNLRFMTQASIEQWGFPQTFERMAHYRMADVRSDTYLQKINEWKLPKSLKSMMKAVAELIDMVSVAFPDSSQDMLTKIFRLKIAENLTDYQMEELRRQEHDKIQRSGNKFTIDEMVDFLRRVNLQEGALKSSHSKYSSSSSSKDNYRVSSVDEDHSARSRKGDDSDHEERVVNSVAAGSPNMVSYNNNDTRRASVPASMHVDYAAQNRASEHQRSSRGNGDYGGPQLRSRPPTPSFHDVTRYDRNRRESRSESELLNCVMTLLDNNQKMQQALLDRTQNADIPTRSDSRERYSHQIDQFDDQKKPKLLFGHEREYFRAEKQNPRREVDTGVEYSAAPRYQILKKYWIFPHEDAGVKPYHRTCAVFQEEGARGEFKPTKGLLNHFKERCTSCGMKGHQANHHICPYYQNSDSWRLCTSCLTGFHLLCRLSPEYLEMLKDKYPSAYGLDADDRKAPKPLN